MPSSKSRTGSRGQLITITMFIVALTILVSSVTMVSAGRRHSDGQALEDMDVDRLKMVETVAKANYHALPDETFTDLWLASHHTMATEHGADLTFEEQEHFNLVTLRSARTGNTLSFILEKK